jgi:Ca-activated chloride channel family protein
MRTRLALVLVFALGTMSGASGVHAAGKASTVVLVIDVSQLMRADDVAPTRLDAVASATAALLPRIPARDRVALVTFGARAHVVQVPTRDRSAIAAKLRKLKYEVGDAPGPGLQAAVELAGRYRPAAIVFAATGARDAGGSPLAPARNAKALGIRLYAVAVGTRQGKVSFDFGSYQNTIPAPADPTLIRQIARAAGGQAFVAPNARGLQAAFDQLAELLAR